MPLRARGEILENRHEGGENHRLVLRVPGFSESRPGQFAMLSAGALAGVPRTDPLLPRPMAVYRTRGEEVEVLYKVHGRGTRLLAEARAGEALSFVGPLGNGFPVPARGERALLVGGGTGIASLYDLARLGAEAGARVSVLLGARHAEDLMGVADFEALGIDVQVATEDGSLGVEGRVTVPLEAALSEGAGAAICIYACGPTPMMRACADLAEKFGVACRVSLENTMACGFGVCLGCAAPMTERVGPKFSLVCRDGPIFDAGDVAWEGLP